MITDGLYECELCGEWRTGCFLCGEAPLIRSKNSSPSYEDECELDRQSASIKFTAAKRQGLV